MANWSTVFRILAATCAILLATDSVQAQFVWYVDDNGQSGNTCTSWANACPELQTALNLANPSDQIWVATGTYLPDYDMASGRHTGDRTATFQLISGVAVFGGFDGSEPTLADRAGLFEQTILRGDLEDDDGPVFGNNDENSFHVVTGSGTNGSAILDGFTITAGNADAAPGKNNVGAGMHNFYGNPTVTHCIFKGNSATKGGGMSNTASSPTLTHCAFIDNRATSSGGGISNGSSSGPTVINCTFLANTANKGGGMLIDGIAPYPTLINCSFSGNTAFVEGGGMVIRGSDPTLINCTFSSNTSGGTGGGIFNKSVFGGGISSPIITNCILWGNTDFFGGMDESSQIHVLDASPVIDYSCVQGLTGGLGGVGNIGNDPLFVDPDGPDEDPETVEDNDYHLSPGSPCIDAANNMVAPLCIDLDGNERFVDDPATGDSGAGEPPVVDMGVYEFGSQPAVPPGGANEDCNANGILDPCEPDCNANGAADHCDIVEGTSKDCNLNGVPDECDIAGGNSADSDGNGVPDECLLVVVDNTDSGGQELGLSVCNVLVQFENPDDLLLSVGFSNVVTNDPAGFYQHSLGLPTAPPSFIIDIDPTVVYDSFVTIGLEVVPPGVIDGTTLDPDFDFNFMGSGAHLVGGWFNVNPANGQGDPDANLQVLIAQLTVRPGYAVSGSLVVFVDDGTVTFPGAFECIGAGCVMAEDCEDGLTCTDDACVEGECVNNPIHAACDDGVACTLDICSVLDGGCVNRASNLDCDDGDSCTSDVCNPAAGTCEHNLLPEGTICDDGDPETINDQCVGGICMGEEGDPDNDGLLTPVDPCPDDPRNLCFGPVAVDTTAGNAIRVNANVSGAECSGDKIDCTGDMWFADFGFNQSGEAAVCDLGGGGEACVISGISDIFGCHNGQTEDIFQCEHSDAPGDPEMTYSFDVPDGNYVVNLLFANSSTATAEPGSRVFDIVIEGQLVYDDFDQAVAAGGSGIAVVRAALVTVSDGNGLQLEFLHELEDPAIKGIEVLAQAATATLTLNTPERCLEVNEQFIVTIDLSDAVNEIVGGQFNLQFDTTVLDFVEADPGDAPFSQEIIQLVDEDAGTLVYAVGVQGGGPGTSADTTMAVLTFQVGAEICGVAEAVSFAPPTPPQQTLLTNDIGSPIAPTTNDLASLTTTDSVPPMITIPPDVTLECGESTAPINTGQAVASDNCDPAPTVTFDDSVDPGSCPHDSLITRTWTVEDACGNVSSGFQIIAVNDTTAPTVTAPADVTVNCNVDVNDLANTGGSATATDECDPALAVTFSDSASGTCPAVITRTWTAEDACGNVGTAVQIITVQPPLLTLSAPDSCVDANEQFIVTIDLSDAVDEIVGGQFNLQFDTTVLDFVEADPGDAPFSQEIIQLVDEDTGTLLYAVGVQGGGPGTSADTTMAVLTFQAGAEICGVAEVVSFALPMPPQQTLLTDNTGTALVPATIDLASLTTTDSVPPMVTIPADVTLECRESTAPSNTGQAEVSDNCDPAPTLTFSDGSSGSCPEVITRTWTANDACGNSASVDQIIVVDDTTAPVMSCPDNITVTPDAGACGAVVEYTVTASDDCDRLPPINCTVDSGEVFEGITKVTCTATDDCGNESLPCSFDVEVTPFNELMLDLKLSPTVVTTSFTRCITLDLWECPDDTLPSATAELDVSFEFDSDQNTGGVFTGTVLVPCGQYTCVTAQDKLHTLRRTLDQADGFGISGTNYVADFITPGKELIGGNLNDDIFIDMLDFAIFVGQFGEVLGDSDCQTPPPHSDIDGDGIVFTEDFTFISINFMLSSEDNCCEPLGAMGIMAGDTSSRTIAEGWQGPIARISVIELRRLGLNELMAADLNDDGWLDEQDMEAFAAGARP